MSTLKEKIISSLTPQPPKPPEPPPAPPQLIQPSHRLYLDLLEFANLPTAGDQTRIDALDDQWRRLEKRIEAYGHNDAIASWKQMTRDILDGKYDGDTPPKFPLKADVIQHNADIRKTIRYQMSKVSKEACLLCADILQEAKDKHLDKFITHLKKSESAVSGAVELLGATPLQKTCEALPKFIEGVIAKLRERELPMIRPGTILKF